MKGSFLSVVTAVAAGSFLLISFCSLCICASDRLPAGHSETSDAWHAGFAQSVAGEVDRDITGAVAAEERNRDAVQGESKRGSQNYRKSYMGSLSNQSVTMHRLLIPALIALGISSAVGARTASVNGPRGDEHGEGRPSATAAGLRSHSLPSGVFVGALALMIIASSLAAPTNQPGNPQGEGSSAASGSGSGPLSSTAAAASVVTSPEPPYSFRFPYKGKLFVVRMGERDAHLAGPTVLQELRETLGRAASGSLFHTGHTVRFFRSGDGTEEHLPVSADIIKCPGCIDVIVKLGQMVEEYEKRLTAEGAEQLMDLSPMFGLPPVIYNFKDNKTRCTIGFEWPDGDRGFKDGGNVVEFRAGDTDFRVVLPKTVERGLDSETLDELVQNLKLEKPTALPLLDDERYGTADEWVSWGYGQGALVRFDTPLSLYTLFLPWRAMESLKEANNGGWEDLEAMAKVTFVEYKRALVRQAMQSK